MIKDPPDPVTPQHYHVSRYGDNEVSEYHDTPVPTFLKYVYAILPVWGIIWFFLYWDGSYGWLDRGYWKELQSSANTRLEKSAESSKDSPSKG